MAVGTVKWFNDSRGCARIAPDLSVLASELEGTANEAVLAALREGSGPDSWRADHRCAKCGYGIVMSDPLPPCPMCHTNRWNQVVRERRPDLERTGTDAVPDELAARRLRQRP